MDNILYQFEDSVIAYAFESACDKINAELEVRGFYGDTTSLVAGDELDELIDECVENAISSTSKDLLIPNYNCGLVVLETAFWDWEEYGSFDNIRDCATVALENYVEENRGDICDKVKDKLRAEGYID